MLIVSGRHSASSLSALLRPAMRAWGLTSSRRPSNRAYAAVPLILVDRFTPTAPRQPPLCRLADSRATPQPVQPATPAVNPVPAISVQLLPRPSTHVPLRDPRVIALGIAAGRGRVLFRNPSCLLSQGRCQHVHPSLLKQHCSQFVGTAFKGRKVESLESCFKDIITVPAKADDQLTANRMAMNLGDDESRRPLHAPECSQDLRLRGKRGEDFCEPGFHSRIVA